MSYDDKMELRRSVVYMYTITLKGLIEDMNFLNCNKHYTSLFTIVRSSFECLSILTMLIKHLEEGMRKNDFNDFDEFMKALCLVDIEQDIKIYKSIEDSEILIGKSEDNIGEIRKCWNENKQDIISKIKTSVMDFLNDFDINSCDKKFNIFIKSVGTYINKYKGTKGEEPAMYQLAKNKTNLVTEALRELDHSTNINVMSAQAIYRMLCSFAHNNISTLKITAIDEQGKGIGNQKPPETDQTIEVLNTLYQDFCIQKIEKFEKMFTPHMNKQV